MSEPGFEIPEFRTVVAAGKIEWQRHVLERMAERGIRRDEVVGVLLNGERIEDYPTNTPFPSALFLGGSEKRPLHVVAAYSAARGAVYVITAYEPDLALFENDLRTRKKKP